MGLVAYLGSPGVSLVVLGEGVFSGVVEWEYGKS